MINENVDVGDDSPKQEVLPSMADIMVNVTAIKTIANEVKITNEKAVDTLGQSLLSLADANQLLSEARRSAESCEKTVSAAETNANLVKIEVDRIVSELAQNLSMSVTTLTETKQKLDETSAFAVKSEAACQKIASDQTVVQDQTKNIGEAQVHANTVRAELDRILVASTRDAAQAEGAQTSATTAASAADSLLGAVKATKIASDADFASIKLLLASSNTCEEKSKKLADKAETVEIAITDYEKALKILVDESKEHLHTITTLLPGAASAGLASAFADRAKTFDKPRLMWERVFRWTLGVLIAFGLINVFTVLVRDGAPSSYDELIRIWLFRLPVVAALLWLIIHASRESALARRLEEDYGYKAAIASSFEGFHKQMVTVGNAAEDNEPLKTLCENTLKIISTPPGRIYAAHKLSASVLSEFAETVAEILNAKVKVKTDDSAILPN